MAILHCYWHLVVNNGNFTCILTSRGQQWAILHLYWQLVVRNCYFILLLTYNGLEWQFHISTDIKWSRMAIYSWSFISIYRNERALLSKSKTWNEIKSGRQTYFGQCPPIWNCLMKNWQLHVSIQSMRTHSKQWT